MTADISKIQFLDGSAGSGDVSLFVAGDLQSGNYNMTRLFVWRGGDEWFHWNFDSMVVSTCMTTSKDGSQRSYYALGQDGLIWVAQSGVGDSVERIEDAGTGKDKLGYVSRIREIDGSVYVCGDQGQVYRRMDEFWAHIDSGLLHKERREDDSSLNDIAGTGETDLYVIDDSGRVFHFDGKAWTDVSPPTNLSLSSIRCREKDDVVICGDEGLLLRGNHNQWEVITEPDENLGCIWDVEFLGDELFCAVEETIMVWQDGKLHPIEFDLKHKPDAHRLSQRDGKLFSIGEEHLCAYDGKKWEYIQHPDNVD
jgi:hypothetical protein